MLSFRSKHQNKKAYIWLYGCIVWWVSPSQLRVPDGALHDWLGATLYLLPQDHLFFVDDFILYDFEITLIARIEFSIDAPNDKIYHL